MNFKTYIDEIAVKAQKPYAPKAGHRVRTVRGLDINGIIEKITQNGVFFRSDKGKLYKAHPGNVMRHETMDAMAEGDMGTALSSDTLRSFREKGKEKLAKITASNAPVSERSKKSVKLRDKLDDALTVLQMRKEAHDPYINMNNWGSRWPAQGEPEAGKLTHIRTWDWVTPKAGKAKGVKFRVCQVEGDHLAICEWDRDEVPDMRWAKAHEVEITTAPKDYPETSYADACDHRENLLKKATKNGIVDLTNLMSNTRTKWDPETGVCTEYDIDRIEPQTRNAVADLKDRTKPLSEDTEREKREKKKVLRSSALWNYVKGKHLGDKEAAEKSVDKFKKLDQLKRD